MDVLGAPQGCDLQSVRVISHKSLAFEGLENAGQPTSTTQHYTLVSYRLTKGTQRRAQRPIGFILDRTGRRALPKEAHRSRRVGDRRCPVVIVIPRRHGCHTHRALAHPHLPGPASLYKGADAAHTPLRHVPSCITSSFVDLF